MRYLFTFLILMLLGTGCREQTTAPPMNGPVASLLDLPAVYQAFDGFAIAGRLKSEGRTDKPSGEWRYNERGQLVEWRRFRFDEVGSADQYRYDAAGQLRFVQHFDNNCSLSSLANCTGPVAWTSYDELTTDGVGRITESRTYLKTDGQWSLRSISAYAYDAQDRMATVLRYDDKGVLHTAQTLTYDTRGNVIAIREQNTGTSADLADRTFRYEYDTAGRNPYANTVYYAAALFLSRNTQLAPGLTYEYRSDSLPARIRQNGGVTDLTYY